MGLLDQITLPSNAADVIGAVEESQVAVIEQQLSGANATIEHLQESLADLELMLEDRGWQRLGMWADQQFSRDGLGRAAMLCRAMAIANPLIRRGLNLRASYVWGSGVEIQARAQGGDEGTQDVNAVIQQFLDDPDVLKVLASPPARETNERTLGTDGNLFVALFTAPLTGRVIPRLVPLEEITEIIKNPEDRTEPWFYKRVSLDAKGGQQTTYHPDIDFRPGAGTVRILKITGDTFGGQAIDPGQVIWDAPIAHQKVNALANWDFGVGDAFAAIAWARAYKEFLEDWAKLVKSLSRFAWRTTSTRTGTAQKAVDAIKAGARESDARLPLSNGSQAGQTAAMVGSTLEAIPKSGATIDSGSGKPLAGMVASAMDIPITMLLSDPGITGARATAETLDTPTELMASMRRSANGEFLRGILGYVIDMAVKAPQGALTGAITRDEWGRMVVTLDGDTERTIEITWPDLTDTPVNILMAAIAEADGMDKLPPLTIVKLMLAALKVKDADEVIDEVTDKDGNFVPPAGSFGQAAADRFNAGQDPAAL